MSGNRIDLRGELARAEAEVERLRGIIAAYPGHADPAKRMLQWEQEHAERVRAGLRMTGYRVGAVTE